MELFVERGQVDATDLQHLYRAEGREGAQFLAKMSKPNWLSDQA